MSSDTVVILLIVGLISYFVYLVGKQQATQRRQKLLDINEAIDSAPDFKVSHRLTASDLSSAMALDAERNKVLLLQCPAKVLINPRSLRVFTQKDIVSVGVVVDGETVTATDRKSQAISTAMGSLLLGGLGGVIVGGLSGKTVSKEQIKKVELRVVVTDPDNPIHDTVLYSGAPLPRSAILLRGPLESASTWQARITTLIKRADKEDAQHSAAEHRHPALSLANELTQLVALRDANVLTEDEFQAQKLRLLNSTQPSRGALEA